jgi:signal transduction histidine kinase
MELRKHVPSVDLHINSGQIEFCDYRQWYLQDGHFDGNRAFKQWDTKERQALDRGYRGMRASGDMAWLEKKDWPDFISYEAAIQQQFRYHRIIGLCTYRTDSCRGDNALKVVQQHDLALAQIDGEWQRIERPGLQTPEEELQRLQRLSAHLVQLNDQERRRVANELFDFTAQDLVAISLTLSRLQSQTEPGFESALQKCRMLCEQNIKAIRRLTENLHPPLLDRLGLVLALESYIERFSERNGTSVGLEVAIGAGRLPLDMETTLFRIVEEALTIMVRHFRGVRAVVRLAKRDNVVVLEVEASDQVLSAAAAAAISGGIGELGTGILSIRERARQIGASLEIRSSDHDTVFRVRVPLS